MTSPRHQALLMPDPARYRGALLGVLIGDALGAPFEGHAGIVPEPRLAEVFAGSELLRYTDDTAMTVAFATSLIRVGDLDEQDLARAFAQQWEADPERGYSSRTAAVLADIAASGRRAESRIRRAAGPIRPSNGAAMRVAPAALYAAGAVDLTVDVARRAARVTHLHPGAVAGACVQAAAVAGALTHPAARPIDSGDFVASVTGVCDEPVMAARLELARQLAQQGDAAEIATVIGTGIAVTESVPAAMCAFLSHPASFRDAVMLAVSLGGDTDTIAAMTGALAGALLGESAIPVEWIERAESSEVVERLADGLFAVPRASRA